MNGECEIQVWATRRKKGHDSKVESCYGKLHWLSRHFEGDPMPFRALWIRWHLPPASRDKTVCQL